MARINYTYRINERAGSTSNPLMRVVGAVVSVLALGAAAFLGFVVFLAVLGFMAVAGAIIAVRVWLFKRRVEKAFATKDQARPAAGGQDRGDYIDAEYTERP